NVAVSMSLAGSRFSSDSAHGPFQHGVRRRGGTIFVATLPSDWRQVQADIRTHLIHRPARDIIPPRGGVRVSSSRPSLLSCRCGLPGPVELGAVNPDAVTAGRRCIKRDPPVPESGTDRKKSAKTISERFPPAVLPIAKIAMFPARRDQIQPLLSAVFK